MDQARIPHKSESRKLLIIVPVCEAGLEGDRTKAIAYANLLTNKVNERQSQMIIDRITGEYKKKKVVKF